MFQRDFFIFGYHTWILDVIHKDIPNKYPPLYKVFMGLILFRGPHPKGFLSIFPIHQQLDLEI